jgi:iron complex outermembrane recepter protein
MRVLLVLAGGLGISGAALAEDDPMVGAEKARALDRIEVAAPRLRGLAAIDTPASLSVQRIDADGAQAEISLAETLGPIPGLLARERQNYAQDTQLAIRGFGARSTFGVRGLRLYADGIPASFPDGQGQISHFVMAAGDRVEVLRGPLSALYGNASGGVLQFFTADPLPGGELRARSLAGADGQRRHSLRAGNQWGAFGAIATVAHFRTEGLRPQSAAERDSGNLKLLADLPGGGRIELVGSHLDLPEAQDPLGLSAAELAADRFGATPAARQFNTRKSVRQTQIGLVVEQPLASGLQLRLAGHRHGQHLTDVALAASATSVRCWPCRWPRRAIRSAAAA